MAKDRKREDLPRASVAAHAASAAIDGAIGFYATEPFYRKYIERQKWQNPLRGGLATHAKKITIGASLGAAAALGPAALVEKLRKMRHQRQLKKEQMKNLKVANFEAELDQHIVELRKLYKISDDESGEPAVITLPSKSRTLEGLKTAAIGGSLGAAGSAALVTLLPGLGKRLGKRAGRVIGKVDDAIGGRVGAAVKGGLTVGGIAAHQAVINVNDEIRQSNAIKRAIMRAKREGKEARFEALVPGMIELESIGHIDYPRLRSGVRLDKYKKTIEAQEIDRKLSNHIRAAILGGAAGAIIPAKMPLVRRVAAGAGLGTGVAAAAHFNAPKDEYGEQSEPAKIIQRRGIQGAGAVAALAGIIMRKRQIGNAVRRVVKRK